MRMVSGFRNKEEHKTEPTGNQKDRAAPFFAALRPQKDRRHSWQMGLMLL